VPILWDENKRRVVLDRRHLDFADVETGFDFANAVIIPAGNKRIKAVGRLNGRPVALIYARLGTEAISLISLRPASKKERKLL
jgi:uncharacterized protein